MKLGCMAGVEYKDKIIFSSTYINGLFELDLNTRKVKFIKTIEGEACEAHLFRKAFLFGEEAWFIPQRANHVICVDLNTYDIEYFELQYNRKFEESKEYLYYYAYIDGLIVNERYLYCIPNGLDSLLVVDMLEHHVSSINVFNDPEKDLMYGAYFYQESVHLLSQKGLLDKIIRVEKNDIEEKKWKFDSTGFLSLVQSGTDLYLIPAYLKAEKTRKLAKVDLVSGEGVYIEMPNISEECYGGVILNDCLLLLPDYGMNFIKVNFEKRTFESVLYPDAVKDKLKNCNNAARIIASERKVLISLSHSCCILEFDKEGNILNYFDVSKLEYDEEQKVIAECKKNIVLPPIVMKEGEDLSLIEYIKLI